jgi:isopenicillin-N N-acyltransferase-like protein
MGMRFVVASDADPAARGKAYGAAIADRLPSVWAAYAHVFEHWAGLPEAEALEFGGRTLELVRTWRPEVADELEAVAVGAGVAPEVVGAMNARTELVSGAECATVGRVRGPEGPWLSQNWDWFLDAPERCVVVEGPNFVTFTEAGILGKIGVNRAGLSLSLDILLHVSDKRQATPTPIHVLLHQILATCSTVDDVVALLDEAEITKASCFTVVAADGTGSCFELSPDGVARLEPEEDGFLHHTNHFLDPVLAEGEGLTAKLERSCTRHDVLVASRPATIAEARATLSDHDALPIPVCRHGEERANLPMSGTAAYIAIDPVARTMEVGPGPTCTSVTETFTLTP